jgi:Flp pilus assembly protein TadG
MTTDINGRSRPLARRFACDAHGAAFVEAAIAFPFLIGMGFLTIEFSNWLYQHHALTTGVRDAARYLARTSDPTNSTYVSNAKKLVCYGDINATTSSRERVLGCNGNVTVGLTPVDNSAFAYRGPATINLITVSTNFNYLGICASLTACNDFATVFGNALTSIPLKVQHTERGIGG